MNIKREIIALAVRILADKTGVVRKPEPFETFLTEIFGGESYDQQIARNVEVELDRAVRTAKRVKTDREFKKITQVF